MTRTLLGVWAHPDDETFLSSGLMLAARERGDSPEMTEEELEKLFLALA